MKLSQFILGALTVASASATTIRSRNIRASLLSKSRRLEENGDEEEEEEDEEYSFLANYKLKLIGCATGEKYQDPEDGEYEYSSVIYRLCPEDDCDDDSAKGCSSGYGDFVVGINSFVESWLEDKKDNMQQDDNFNVDEFSECREYEADQEDAYDEDEGNEGNGAAYYVGPACIDDDGTAGIKLGFFSDYTCTTEPEDVTFEDISNGWSLPYSDSGLVTGYCESCAGYNDDGEYELSEMCPRLYEDSGKCETNMEIYGGNGKYENACETIEELMPAAASSSAGKVIGWLILILVVLGIAAFAYTKWWTKRKSSSTGGTSDGVMS